MQGFKFPCPHCKAVLRSPKAVPNGATIKCVKCQKPFQVKADTMASSTAATYDGTTVVPPSSWGALAQAVQDPTDSVVNVRGRRRKKGGGLVLLLALFLLLGGAVGVGAYFYLGKNPSDQAVAVHKETPSNPAALLEKLKIEKLPDEEKKPAPPPPVKKERVVPTKVAPVDRGGDPPPLEISKTASKSKVDQPRIDAAVEKGVKFLRDKIDATGTWKPGETLNPVGHAALPALALIECKVPITDPAIQAAGNFVRKHAASTEETYDIGCAILLLDRLDNPADKDLITSLAMRLVAGQTVSGAWTYQCPIVGNAMPLFAFLEKKKPKFEFLMAVESDSGAKPGVGAMPFPNVEKKEAMPTKDITLPKELENLPIVQYQKKPDAEQFFLTRGDNSNTQFALLGLWVARRHGVPVERSLEFAAQHFRKTQNKDGGWGYIITNPTKNTMTCVGLMGMALGHGAAAEAFHQKVGKEAKPSAPLGGDEHINEALASLVKYLDPDNNKEMRGLESRIDLYFLWALERIGVLYQTENFGKREWYTWGARIILDCQQEAGSWELHYHNSIDTSFALLFLKRSNLVQKLTDDLKLYLIIPKIE